MQVAVTAEGERLVARPRGRLDAAEGSDFALTIEQQLTDAAAAVTVDLAELDHISLAGIRSVLQLARSLKASKRELDFVHGSEAVRDALRQAGFDELFTFDPPFHSHRGIRR